MKFIKWIVSSLRAKLLMMFLFLTVIPLILVGMISYMKSYDIFAQKSYSIAQIQLAQLRSEYDEVIQDIKRFTEIGKKDSTVQFLIDKQNTAEESKSILGMIKLYRESYQYSDSIMNIKIIGLDGKAVSEDRGVHRLDSQALTKPPFVTLLDEPTKTLIQPIYKNSNPALSMTSTIVSDSSKEVIGFIDIVIKASVFKDILHDASLKTSGTIQIQSESGTILFSHPQFAKNSPLSGRKLIEENSSGYFTKGSEFFVYDTSELTGWKFIRYTPLTEITKEANEIRSLIVLTVGSILIFTIGLYIFITSRLILPLRILKKKMKQASQGDLEVKFENKGTDEIAELGENFNSMLIKIKALLMKSVNEQKQLKTAELRTMQAQINPHFLYNSLETIIWMTEARKTEQVIEITKALSHFFRISLSKGKDVISLEDEINHIRNYLTIQKMRYQDILDVTFHLNEDILDYEIIKLTLQPIVENAIYHGIKNKRGKGFVRIKGDFTPEGYISIDVIDNGIGIKEDKLEEIRSQLSQGVPFEKEQGGFGMVNVHQRIHLRYGEPFGLTINSWYGSGTRVSLIIPAEGRSR
ncbi:cache domain-containing sensor histidine kinase [Metabacillus halosaccharovorans]|uniref:cache domain-containing sensor histidine kinase n=1 Tax=Metabacillus halosaccharovorans TaxID=930124 RepID=UPI001C1FFEE0|nr:sensor histidine kinase [Metabacillus halosaccharovorans]MBU7591261.1 sensor histidine kinase [Metabacillus halosaccharovorans]